MNLFLFSELFLVINLIYFFLKMKLCYFCWNTSKEKMTESVFKNNIIASQKFSCKKTVNFRLIFYWNSNDFLMNFDCQKLPVCPGHLCMSSWQHLNVLFRFAKHVFCVGFLQEIDLVHLWYSFLTIQRLIGVGPDSEPDINRN